MAYRKEPCQHSLTKTDYNENQIPTLPNSTDHVSESRAMIVSRLEFHVSGLDPIFTKYHIKVYVWGYKPLYPYRRGRSGRREILHTAQARGTQR